MKAKRNEVDPPVKPVRSSVGTRIVKGFVPGPEPVKQLVGSTITRDNKYGWDDLSPAMQQELVKSVISARQRTGNDKGGTEYIDYGSRRLSDDINSLGTNAIDTFAGSYLSPQFQTATTIGRVSYDYDPTTDTYKVYDSYDFSKVGDSDSLYGKTRKAAGKIGVTEGTPNLIAEFKGADFADYKGSGFSYDAITTMTDFIGDKLGSLFSD